MNDKKENLPWDYFLTNYEKDLLLLSMENVIKKYPGLTREQIALDLDELLKVAEHYGSGGLES